MLHHMITNLIAIRIRDLDGVKLVSNSMTAPTDEKLNNRYTEAGIG